MAVDSVTSADDVAVSLEVDWITTELDGLDVCVRVADGLETALMTVIAQTGWISFQPCCESRT